ncbi:MAG: hypothetical protein NXH75_02955, partial [Halobacteriovoraceae bacterium]|nr:hypothetical protein [Halobacteriovoraceae bacterium]
MNKSLLLPLLVVLSLNSQASWLDRLRADLSKDIYTSFHGEGLPLVVGSTETGLQYRQNFINQNRITSKVDEYGIVQFDNNDVGIALLKKGNDDHAFLNILDKRNYVKMDEWRNGPQFLKALKKYTKDYGCIPKITSLSHGWASGDRPGEGSGLSGNRG